MAVGGSSEDGPSAAKGSETDDRYPSVCGLGMWTTIKMIRAKFPTVEYITTNTLTKWLQLGRADERKIILMVRN